VLHILSLKYQLSLQQYLIFQPLFATIFDVSASLKKILSLLSQISLNSPLFGLKYSLWDKERGKSPLWVKEAKKPKERPLPCTDADHFRKVIAA